MQDIHLLIGFIFIVFGLIGLVRPTRLHQAVAIKKFSLGKRRVESRPPYHWNDLRIPNIG